MPSPVPISEEVIRSIKDLIDKSRLAGFDHGYAIGYESGFQNALDSIRKKLGAIVPDKSENFVDINKVREDFGLADDSKPSPIVEAYGFEIIETDSVVPKPRKKRLVSVKALGLSTKTQNALMNAGITKIKQLTEMSTAELRKVPRIGAGSVKEIVAVLKKHGRSLRA
jgi:DNA-directed RNA polymerase alpha subunit